MTRIATYGILLFLWSAGPTQAQSPLVNDVAMVAALAAHGADLYTTGRCIGAGTCREANPFLSPFVNTPLAFGATKMAVAGTVLTVKRRYRDAHPRLVFWVSVAETCFVAAVATHNARLAGRR
jgi:Fe-S-cluster-containing dehydrogenase component